MAVTVSICDSATVMTVPTDSSSSATALSCSSLANRPLASALTPAPTSIGALGITRTTGAPAASLDSKNPVDTPAATDTRTCSVSRSLPSASNFASAAAISVVALSTSEGLTATTMKSAPSTASATSLIRMEYASARALARAGTFSETTMSLACRPALSSPEMSASPILPPPIIAILDMATSMADQLARPETAFRRAGGAGGVCAPRYPQSARWVTLRRPDLA
ncbi:Uncharacterised protein [Mycobacteroides abscessus subsp. abscessus]|nr:Uncharacterised protein [Mycobacteroides abscessus subsp. abscessus]